MDTTGHHLISEIGENLLRSALERANPERRTMRLGAFYLGNWITDLSQVIDHRLYNKALIDLEGVIGKVGEMFRTGRRWVESLLPSDAVFEAAFNVLLEVVADRRRRAIEELRQLIADYKPHVRIHVEFPQIELTPNFKPEVLSNSLRTIQEHVNREFIPQIRDYESRLTREVEKEVNGVLDRAAEAITDRLQDVDRWHDSMDSRLRNVMSRATQRSEELRARKAAELAAREQEVVAAVREVFQRGADSKLGRFMHSMVYVVGYLKFVIRRSGLHLHHDKMDPDAYEYVYEQRFREYFPHEHLDRPEVGNGLYAEARASCPRNKRRGRSSERDLYEYLREDLWMLSGYLSYLDGGPQTADPGAVSWAEGSFNPNLRYFTDHRGQKQEIDDTNPEWNQHLALLGHALHGVEDFFAHSTFVEHASGSLPGDFEHLGRQEHGDILARRLKRWRAGANDIDWHTLADETHVVTGYFDPWDLLVSLSHVVETLFGKLEKVGRGDEGPEGELLRDALEFVGDQRGVWKGQGRSNRAIAILLERYASATIEANCTHAAGRRENLDLLVAAMQAGPLTAFPQGVKDALAEGLRLAGESVTGVDANGESTLHRVVSTVGGFVSYPAKAVLEVVSDLGGVIRGIGKAGSRLVAELQRLSGSRRVGCHSLLAKDTGPELLHHAAFRCAGAVHWYVVQTMTRHGHAQNVQVARGHVGDGHRNKLYLNKWIDWLELIEFFLTHPLADVNCTPQTLVLHNVIDHVTRGNTNLDLTSPDQLSTLAEEYKSRFHAVPGGPRELTWEIIADANFGTAGLSRAERIKRVNDRLRTSRTGVRVAHGNYAYKPGIAVRIPLGGTAVVMRAADAPSQWWYPVMMSEGEFGFAEVAQWFDADGELRADAPPYAHRRFATPAEEQRTLMRETSGRRQGLEAEYTQ